MAHVIVIAVAVVYLVGIFVTAAITRRWVPGPGESKNEIMNIRTYCSLVWPFILVVGVIWKLFCLFYFVLTIPVRLFPTKEE
jgi:hypothetical protein